MIHVTLLSVFIIQKEMNSVNVLFIIDYNVNTVFVVAIMFVRH